MLIQDDELRQLFQAESEEHLQGLEQGLLRLEDNPAESETLDNVFRAAHSLKGAAKMLELAKVEAVAHRMEDVLGTARRGTVRLSADEIDRLYKALDAMREFCVEAITGEVGNADVASVLEQMGDEPAPPVAQQRVDPDILTPEVPRSTAQSPPEPAEQADEDTQSFAQDTAPSAAAAEDESTVVTAPLQPAAPTEGDGTQSSETASSELVSSELVSSELVSSDTASSDTKAADSAPQDLDAIKETPGYTIDTIRVQSHKLDGLMSQAGELSVTHGRIAHRVSQVEKLAAICEEWNREFARVRPYSADGGREIGPKSADEIRQYLAKSRARLSELGDLIKELEAGVQGDDVRVDLLAGQLEAGIRNIRLLPLSTVFNLFPRMVRDLGRSQSKEAKLVIEGGDTAADKRILEDIKDPLTHMLRNAMDHGIEPPDERERLGKPRAASIVLRGFTSGAKVYIEIIDDGCGIDVEAIKRVALKRRVCSEDDLAEMTDAQLRQLIFSAGFSTKPIVTDVSGRGVGMDVVRANVERLRGNIEIESTKGEGTIIRLAFPVTLTTRRVMIVAVGHQKYAVPLEYVETTRLVSQDEIFSMQNRGTIVVEGQPLPVAHLADYLDVPDVKAGGAAVTASGRKKHLACLILAVNDERFGFLVDQLIDEQEVVIKSHGGLLKRVRNVSGSTILQTGEVCIVVNPHDLIKAARSKRDKGSLADTLAVDSGKKEILLVEDSIVTRTQEKRILESAGFEVTTAVDGMDGYNKLLAHKFSAVVSDVEMPKMDGLSLTAKIRQHVNYEDLPVILLTSLSTDADRKRGLDVGADAYLTKPGFDQSVLLETLRRLV